MYQRMGMENKKEDFIKDNKNNMQEVEEPGSYAFLIFPICMGIFIISLLVFLIRMAFSDPLIEGYELMILGILSIIFIPIILAIIFTTLRFYRIEGRKRFLISNERFLIELPLKPIIEIKWSDFDELLITTRGKYGKGYTNFKIQFLRQAKFNNVKKVRYRLNKKENVGKMIDLISSYATLKNVMVKIDRKDI